MKKKCGNGEEEKRRNEVKRLRGEKCLKEKVKKGKSESFFFFFFYWGRPCGHQFYFQNEEIERVWCIAIFFLTLSLFVFFSSFWYAIVFLFLIKIWSCDYPHTLDANVVVQYIEVSGGSICYWIFFLFILIYIMCFKWF